MPSISGPPTPAHRTPVQENYGRVTERPSNFKLQKFMLPNFNVFAFRALADHLSMRLLAFNRPHAGSYSPNTTLSCTQINWRR